MFPGSGFLNKVGAIVYRLQCSRGQVSELKLGQYYIG